jgi:hypothetical protein
MCAAADCRSLIGVAGRTLHRLHLIRMGIFLDGGVAIGAAEAAVHARMELIAIDADALTGRILQRLVRMAGETVRLREEEGGKTKEHRNRKSRRKTS